MKQILKMNKNLSNFIAKYCIISNQKKKGKIINNKTSERNTDSHFHSIFLILKRFFFIFYLLALSHNEKFVTKIFRIFFECINFLQG